MLPGYSWQTRRLTNSLNTTAGTICQPTRQAITPHVWVQTALGSAGEIAPHVHDHDRGARQFLTCNGPHMFSNVIRHVVRKGLLPPYASSSLHRRTGAVLFRSTCRTKLAPSQSSLLQSSLNPPRSSERTETCENARTPCESSHAQGATTLHWSKGVCA